jgi:3'(2'), 5'-bisphosphate nucleotidase
MNLFPANFSSDDLAAVTTLVDGLLPILLPLTWEGVEILRYYYRQDELETKDKGDSPVTAADLAVNELLMKALPAAFGSACGYLSEETYTEGMLPLPEAWVWIIDPLDGTRNFIEHSDEYALHIALTYRQRPVFTIVAIPEKEIAYVAASGWGCYRYDRTGNRQQEIINRQKKIEEAILVVTKNHTNPPLQKLLDNLPMRDYLNIGSVGCKIASIVDGRSDIYIARSHKSAPMDWDFAAPELILTEAGGTFLHLSGNPPQYNTPDPHQWGCFVASVGIDTAEVLAMIRSIDEANDP